MIVHVCIYTLLISSPSLQTHSRRYVSVAYLFSVTGVQTQKKHKSGCMPCSLPAFGKGKDSLTVSAQLATHMGITSGFVSNLSKPSDSKMLEIWHKYMQKQS